VDTNLRLDRVRAFSERLREISGYALEPYKPLVGENLYSRESGAVASQFHDPPAIEPYSSDVVGAERRIVLGKKSGIDSIRIKAEQLGLDLSADAQRDLLVRVKELGTTKRGLVTDDEFRKLAGG
jgi:isopropylmalate/homocitrate/citramalate synthase